ncbi:MAG: cytochrome b/b6 domain-containing protein [Marinibacterium sp.]
MQAANTRSSYGTVAKSLHWLTAALIFTIFPLGMIGEDLSHAILAPDSTATEADRLRAALIFSVHKTLGVTVFFVALARIAWAVGQPRPGLLNAGNRIEAWLAHTVHWALYGALVLVPLSGWIHHAATTGFAPIWWPLGQSLPFVPKDPAIAALFASLHGVFTKVLLLAVTLHVAGALKHHVIDKDATLRRMLPGRGPWPEPPAPGPDLPAVLTAGAGWAAAIALGVGLWSLDDPSPAARAAPLAAVPSDWQVIDGDLGIQVRQLGNPVRGTFSDWTAAITFDDPGAPGPAGHVTVTVAIGSLALGSVTDQAMGPDYFDEETYPTAIYDADLLRTDSGYEAQGTLTLKGVSLPLTLPFTLSMDGNRAHMQGHASLLRLDYGIGASVPDAKTLGPEVGIDVQLTAERSGD